MISVDVRGVLIGRFQPFHGGHLEVVRSIRATRPADPLVLGIGSAQESYTSKNPFTAGERFAMIEAALADAEVSRCTIVPLPDIDRHAQWVAYLESLLPPFDRVYTNNPLTRLLFERAHYSVESRPIYDRARFEGDRIREQLATRGAWRSAVPLAVAKVLTEIDAPARLRLLRSGERRPSGSAPP